MRSNISRKAKMLTIAPKSVHGFATTLFGQKSDAPPCIAWGSRISENDSRKRLFLISNPDSGLSPRKPVKKKTKIQRTNRNRKRITFEDYLTRGVKEYRVNAAKSGLYLEIIEKLIEQFEIAWQIWGRVFVLRFDLHSHFYSADNRRMSKFRDRICKRLRREYGFDHIGLCWVREREKAKAQHYHCVLFLDGNKIRHSSRINKIIKDAWEDETGAHHMPVIKSPFYFVDNQETADKAIYRISYLAKARGKGYRDNQAKDYQCSRMKPR